MTPSHKECMSLYCKENISLKNMIKLLAIKSGIVKLLYAILK